MIAPQFPRVRAACEVVAEPVLHCPECGGDFLHSRSVTVFDRAEDASVVRKTIVADDVTIRTVEAAGSGNPSIRRHGVAIQFWCEVCRADIELTFGQHKGQTEIAWRGAARNTATPERCP